jgi:ribosomal protein S18 acetylase RimI-like enzyme
VIQLQAMTDEEAEQYRAGAQADYAEQIVRAGDLSPEAAAGKAARDLAAAPSGAQYWHLFADDEEVVVGVLVAGPQTDPAEPYFYVYDVHVAPEHRGKGFGRQAMEAAVAEGRRLGLPSVRLNVWGGNDVALRLYESMGFQVTSRHLRLGL